MARPLAHTQLYSRIPGQRHHANTKRGKHNTHGNIWDTVRIRLSTLKLEVAIITSQQACKTYNHLAKRWMNIKVKLALEIMRAEFAKMGFIPNDNIGCTNFVVSRPTGEKSVDDGWEVFDVLQNKFRLRARLCTATAKKR
jgi:hypothetical protein